MASHEAQGSFDEPSEDDYDPQLIKDLIEKSSLGTPEARAIQARCPDEDVESVLGLVALRQEFDQIVQSNFRATE